MAKTTPVNESIVETSSSEEKNNTCGIIMPIAKTDGYPEKHWSDVYSILCESAKMAGFEPNLVSFDDDAGVIHKRIVQNIYSNPIVICDISSRNANVMLELGMRLAFDKPTIIVKDDKTPYSFDIAAIEHIEYPSDLRYQSINDFKEKLKIKITETYRRSQSDPEYTTFLKHFGTFKVAKIEEKEVSGVEFLAAEVKELKELITSSALIKKQPVTRQFKAINFDGAKFTSRVKVNDQILNRIDLQDLNNYLLSLGVATSHISKLENNDGLRLVWELIPGTQLSGDMDEYIKDYLETIS